MSESEIWQLVEDYRTRVIPLDRLESQLLEIDIPEESDLSRQLVGLLAEASHAHWSETGLREELENAARPFAPRLEHVSNDLFLVRKELRREGTGESGKTEVLRKPPVSAGSAATSGTSATLFQRVPAQG